MIFKKKLFLRGSLPTFSQKPQTLLLPFVVHFQVNRATSQSSVNQAFTWAPQCLPTPAVSLHTGVTCTFGFKDPYLELTYLSSKHC